MTIFDDAKDILNKEIQTYKSVFDNEISDKLSKTSTDYDSEKHFDTDLTAGIADFAQLCHWSSITEAYRYKKEELNDLTSENMLKLMIKMKKHQIQ